MIVLHVKKGPLLGQAFQVPPQGKVIVGRSSICDVAIVDFKLSRIHCQIEFEGANAFLEDLGSRNGTYLNGRKLAGREPVKPGDEVGLGDTAFVIEDAAEEAPDAPKKKPGADTFMRTREACSRCGAIIPKRDLQTKTALLVEGKPVCSHCLDPLLEQEFAGYRVVRKLGSGAMGSVYEGMRVSDSQPVALKFLAKNVTSNADAVKRFLREAVSGGALDHPNIVKVFESGVDVDRGLYFLAMEYVEGTNARNLIAEKGTLNPHQCLSIGIQVMKALEAAFGIGIVHRDIKPANILVDTNGRAKLVDLGTAKSMQTAGLGSLTRTGIGMGTVAYMPPEQIEDAKHADHRSDQYSLGASLYHMLTGQRPFGGKTPGEYFKAIRFQEVRWPEKSPIPEPVRRLIERMMAKDPKDRFQDPAEVAKAMEEVLSKI